ncbi:hypothetical protein [Bordetella genomosp. 8]|uniref:hypothetical protein n=1 Tax=Bordetella genomosp. 8 TaxID=1416806 RepID=UPI0012FD0965|nr:hypothetical protein [Bordetella genomosp. 8]
MYMKIYRERAYVYLGLVGILLASTVLPIRFLFTVVADSIASFFPIALTVLALSRVLRRALASENDEKLLGISTIRFCVGLGVLGAALMATYPFIESAWPPRFGMTIWLADIEIYLYHRESINRRASAKPEAAAGSKLLQTRRFPPSE